ncbi:MAG: ROK family protein [Caulobacteraceae bacterium]
MPRLGVDFGGTKIEAAVLGEDGAFLARRRRPNPGDYDGSIEVVRRLIEEVETEAGVAGLRVGLGIPGSRRPSDGAVRNANSVWLNGRLVQRDLTAALDRPVRVENDANCFALSEATDGAGAGAAVVFGVIVGTGCGGGLVVDQALRQGRSLITGEWGHTPLPWPVANERDSRPCWCGRDGCLETWVSGTAFCLDYTAETGRRRSGAEIADLATAGDRSAAAALDRYIDRLGRGLAVVCDILDPDVIVLGGGMSNVAEIYPRIGAVLGRWVFCDDFSTPVRPARHGDSSGVRGAAWLWPAE